MRQTIPTPLIALSARVYRTLLIFYPADYRREYSALMVQVFRDVCRDKYQQQGSLGVALWWCTTLLDLTLTVFEQRRKVRFEMSKSTFIQLTGILLIVGGVCGAIAAFSQFQPSDHSTYQGVYQLLIWLLAPGFSLVGLGCIGLALRYDEALGTLGKWMLYLCGFSALVMGVGIVGMSINDSLWYIWLGSSIVHTLALTAFGVLHLRKPVLPIFRALPLQMAGGWLFVLLGAPARFPQPFNNVLTFLMFFGMGMAWFAIGLAINRQQKNAALAAASAA